MSLRLLLEIGTEEVPDSMLRPALENLKEALLEVTVGAGLGGQLQALDATPRRLMIRLENLRPSQPDEQKTLLGPPCSIGEGAARGFAKKSGIAFEDLKKIDTPKGEYYGFEKQIRGRSALDILAEEIPGAISKIYFPKTMYWTGKNGFRFIRPIRWLVCLLGSDVIPLEISGVSSGNTTRGHRILGQPDVPVTIENYEAALAANGVVVSSIERRRRIEEGIFRLLEQSGYTLHPDESLLETLVFLTETPTPIRGSFDPSYLELPGEILRTVMRHHQRYFSILDERGNLAPEFIAVMNTDQDPEGLVRKGNERVLRARFNDARFFWDVDLSRPFESRSEDLKNVTFHAKLGSYYQKTERNVSLARDFAAVAEANRTACIRAAELAKCDLTTEMVKEFTELQGIVGGLYARHSGEPEEVWRAVYEQYRPASMEDAIPDTLTGQIVSLADKTDTLRKCFEIGLVPTGSRDPLALRRAAQGVVRILAEGRVRIGLSAVSDRNAQLHEFLLDRVRYYFKEVRGYAYDEINAVIASGADDLRDADQRLQAIQAVRPTENFEPLAASFKRIRNILRQAEDLKEANVDPALLEPGAEAELYEEFGKVREQVYFMRQAQNYRSALTTIASIRPRVDVFFDRVLVNAPQADVRQNRLMLLNSLLSEFSTIADFSEIVITQ